MVALRHSRVAPWWHSSLLAYPSHSSGATSAVRCVALVVVVGSDDAGVMRGARSASPLAASALSWCIAAVLVDASSASAALVAFSDEMTAHDRAVKEFLFPNMYRHTRVMRMTSKARRIVRDLFDLLLSEPFLLPEDWRADSDASDTPKTARKVADYIAGMTDRFALDEHSRLFDPAVNPC